MTNSLSNAERNCLRRVITSSEGWQSYRKKNGINSGDLVSSATVLHACHALGIDWRAVLSDRFNEVDVVLQDATEETEETDGATEDETTEDTSDDEDDPVERKFRELRELMEARKAAEEKRKAQVIRPRKGKHSQYPILVRLCQISRTPVLLVGPKATGKTTACIEAAAELGLPFHFQSIAMESFDLTGWVKADGEYLPTAFVTAFRDGGLFLADEIDAWQPQALLAINAPLSVGKMTLPNGEQIEQHKDFVCVAAANTWGHGATNDYNAREKLDAATVSRFAYKVDWNVDLDFELSLLEHKQWGKECQAARTYMQEAGLPDTCDLRAMLAGDKLLANGFTVEQARALTYLAGFDSDQVKSVVDHVGKV